MSDFLLLARRGDLPIELLSRLSFTCQVPGFPQGETREVMAHGVYAALFNPHAGATLTEDRLALGDVGLTPVVEAILRRDTIELGSDYVGSRPVWFYHDERYFVASSSQFCITSLFDDLDLSFDAVGWLLASGYVGHVAYDRRVRRLPGASTLTLDRRDWSVSLLERRGAPPRRGSVDTAEVAALIDDVIDKIRMPSSPVLVPISGGADSRVLLAKTARRHEATHTGGVLPVTWGARDAFRTRKHDAAVARAVCENLGLPFTYLEELAEWTDPEQHFAQFIAYSEGAVDHLHMQRLRPVVARWCAERGVSLMIRGDEAFGWRSVRSEAQCRRSIDLFLPAELATAWPELEAIWEQQVIPEFFQRRHDESLGSYRDRLYREVRCAGLLSYLNAGFAKHCEVINPFLEREVVCFFASLPDQARENKRAFACYTKMLLPHIPIAEFGAITETNDILSNRDVQDFICDRLRAQEAVDLFGPAICDRLIGNIYASSGGSARRRLALHLRGEVIYWVGKERLRRLLAHAPTRGGISSKRMALRMVIALEATKRIRHLQSTRARMGVPTIGAAPRQAAIGD